MTSRIFLLCVALLILPSCIYVQRRPNGWSTPSTPNINCPDISGVYANQGRDAGGEKFRLNVALIPTWKMIYEKSITRAEIIQTGDETVKIRFWSDNVVTLEKAYSKAKGDYSCESGWMVMDQPAHRTLSKFILGVDWGWDGLSKTSAGDLVIRKRNSGIGLFAVIPVAATEWLWLHFDKAERETSTDQEDAPDVIPVR